MDERGHDSDNQLASFAETEFRRFQTVAHVEDCSAFGGRARYTPASGTGTGTGTGLPSVYAGDNSGPVGTGVVQFLPYDPNLKTQDTLTAGFPAQRETG